MVMELFDGKPIFDIGDIEFFKEARRASILNQIYTAISLLNQIGIVHRDLKNENILMDKDSKIMIIDFGLSLIPKNCKETNFCLAGTPGFLDPVLIENKPSFMGSYTSLSDIYAIGLIHYCMLERRHPFIKVGVPDVLE